MATCRPSFALIAKWKQAKDVYFMPPDNVHWDDGSLATQREYQIHRLDTQELVQSKNGGLTAHIYPEIVAVAKFDALLERWRIEGQGVIPAVLELRDPGAHYDAIRCAVCKLPTFYRIQIQRLGISSSDLLVGKSRESKARGGSNVSDFDYLWLHCHHRGID